MIKSIKLRIYPNKTQLNIINNTLGACNFVKNKYLEYNINEYKKDKKFITGNDFSVIINKCLEYGIKLRLVDTYYPSTQICSSCGSRNKNIRLIDRTYVCDKCRLVMDRDENSAINIYNCKSKYYIKIA